MQVIAALAQFVKAGKDISDAQQADEWISNLPTAVTKENIANVEAELAALQKLIDGMSVEGKSLCGMQAVELIKTIVADYHIELAGQTGVHLRQICLQIFRQRQSTIRLSRSAGAAWITQTDTWYTAEQQTADGRRSHPG